MSGIMGMMDIAKTSMAAEQLAVEVTSNNIANVNTPGYSREQVMLQTAPAVTYPYGPLGYGVQVQGITRAFDPYVTAKLDQNTSLLSGSTSQKSDLDQVATLFNETESGGVNDLLTGFWNAWQNLSDNPSGAGERQALVSSAQSLTDALNFRADQLVQLRTSITQSVDPTIDEINSHLANIADLNKQILETESSQHQANSLRDQRQVELNSLSSLIGVNYYTTGDGTINVALSDGTSLVESGKAWSLKADTTGGTIKINWQGPGNPPQTKDVTAAVTTGQLGGTLSVRDTLIPQYQTSLDNIAKEMVAAVNTQHSQGAGLDLFTDTTSSNYVTDPNAVLADNPDLSFGDRIAAGTFNLQIENNGTPVLPPTAINITTGAGGTTLNDLVTQINAASPGNIQASLVNTGGQNHLEIKSLTSGYSFGFSADGSKALMALGVNTFFTGDSAFTIGVNNVVASDQNLIAAGRIDAATGAHPPGDNSNSLDLADMGGEAAGPGGLTFADAYRQLVSGIGNDTAQAGSNQTFYQGLVDQFQQLQDSVSGVSLDEELTNLIKYQRAYQAAAKMVSVGDEMLQTLLSIKQ